MTDTENGRRSEESTMKRIVTAFSVAATLAAGPIVSAHAVDNRDDKGTIEELFEYWIKGKNTTKQTPQWSVIRDVLHWVD